MKTVAGLLVFTVFLGSEFGFAKKTKDPADKIADAWDKLLKTYVDPKSGKVDYLGLDTVGRNDLKKVLDLYAKLDGNKLSQNSRKAAYINFYNAGMVYNILRFAEKEKIKTDSKAFLELKINKIRIGGETIWASDYKFEFMGMKLHLDNIEHGLIRKDEEHGNFDDLSKADRKKVKDLAVQKLDPRIHAAVNCAAISCPRVRESAYRESNVERMLDENMREWVNSSVQFKKQSSSKMIANKITKWYYDDFDDYGEKNNLKGAGGYLASFVDEKSPDGKWRKEHFSKYFNDLGTWSLNTTSKFDFEYKWKINDKRN